MSEEIKVSKQWIAKAKNDWFMPTKEDAEEARKAVSRVMLWLQNALPEAFSG